MQAWLPPWSPGSQEQPGRGSRACEHRAGKSGCAITAKAHTFPWALPPAHRGEPPTAGGSDTQMWLLGRGDACTATASASVCAHTARRHKRGLPWLGEPSRRLAQNLLGYGGERGEGGTVREIPDEVSTFLQAPRELRVQRHRACQGRGQGKGREGQRPASQPHPTQGSQSPPLAPSGAPQARLAAAISCVRGAGSTDPRSGPAVLTQEGDSGESGQLLPASPGEDVGALLEHRRAGPPEGTSHTLGGQVQGGPCHPQPDPPFPAPCGGWPAKSPRLTAQCGQTKPLMFSTTPTTCSPVFLQKVSSRLTSPTDTACDRGAENSGPLQSAPPRA